MDLSQSLIHVIACGVLTTDLRHVTSELNLPISVESLPGGLHARPDDLRKRLQERIDHVSSTFRGERIVLGYGVCGLGAVGLQARHVPLVIPRVNDCIALFLGSDNAYQQQFAKYPGTYYASAGWIEEKSPPQQLANDRVHRARVTLPSDNARIARSRAPPCSLLFDSHRATERES